MYFKPYISPTYADQIVHAVHQNKGTYMKILKILIPIVLLIAGYGSMQFFLGQRTDPPRKPPVVKIREVQAKRVVLSDVTARITAFGRLTSAQPVQINSEAEGRLIEGDVPFKPGQSFARGDVLLRIDDRQVRLDLNGVKSDFLNALASVLPEVQLDFPQEYRVWQAYFDQAEFDRPLDDLPEAQNRKIKLFLSRFNVYKLYFQARNLEIGLEKHIIRAPFDGAIVSTGLRAGSTARDGTLLGEIINLENLEVEVPVQVQDIQWIDRGKPVVFTSSEIQGQWEGRISRIGKSIDARTQTVPIYCSISTPRQALYSGVFLRADIPGKIIPNAVALPQSIIYNGRYAYLVEEGELAYREVNIARKETEIVIVAGGLATGDTLITELLQGVAPGMPARAVLSSGALIPSSLTSLEKRTEMEMP